MSSGSKRVVVGYWYRLLYHFGICRGPVDAFLEFRAGDRAAWSGVLRQSGRLSINKPNLWGGQKSEGGLVGDLDVMMGEQAQQPNSYLAGQLGVDQPAYRGKLSIVWRGGRWGAMNPYPKKASVKLRRILKGWDDDTPWYPERAEIVMIQPEPMALYFALDISGSMSTITPNGQTRLANMKSAVVNALQIIADVVLVSNVAVDIIIVGWGTQPSTRSTMTRRRCTVSDINTLKTFVNGLSSGLWTYFPAGLIDMAAFYAGAPAGAKKIVFFCTDGLPTTSDDSMTAGQVAAAAAALVRAQVGVSVYGVNIDLNDTSYTAQVDNTPDDGVPVISGDNPGAITNIIISAIGGLIAMNPIHILYDTITAKDMMAEPIGMIADAAWREAADKIWLEGLGLCTKYDGADLSDIEAFQQRICDIIGANLNQSLTDGLYYIDLIRGDHDIEGLPIVNADDIVEFSQEPSVITEQVNQVTVEWFDALAKQIRSTAPIQLMGAIQAAGRVLPETREYPEVTSEPLALRLAARDLQAGGTPTNRFRLTLNRRLSIRCGQPFRLQYPAEGIGDMVCVLGDYEGGTLLDGRTRIVAVQNVFSFPDTVYVDSQPGLAEPPSNLPIASPYQRVIEAPFVELVTSLSRLELDSLPEDAGVLLTIATRPENGLNYSIYSGADGEVPEENGTGEWCPTAQIVESAGFLDTDFTMSNGSDLGEVALGTWALWDDEIVRVDAIDPQTMTIQLGRGCADTVPAAHVEGSRIFFCGDWVGTDDREYVDGDQVRAFLLTRTSTELQGISNALENSVEMVQRQHRPYPPGRLRLNDLPFPDSLSGDIVVSFAHRDRLLQADKLFDADAADIGPEPGTTYELEIRDRADGSLSYSAISSTSPITVSSPDLPFLSRLLVYAKRSGLRSLQGAFADFEFGDFFRRIAFPLTYDEDDADGIITWLRNGIAPHVTPIGFEGDGFSARYKSTAVPAWLSPISVATTLHASVRVDQPRAMSSRDSILMLGANTIEALPRLELAVVADPSSSVFAAIAVRASTSAGVQSLVVGRPQWRYERPYPLLSVGAFKVRPQAILFEDSSTLIVVGHFQDTESRAWRIRVSDGEVLAEFTFGTVNYRHVVAIARRSNGDVWATDYNSAKMIRIDLGASFSSGSAVVLNVFDLAALTGVSGVNFVTVAGTEYALVSEYRTTGTAYLYVIAASLLGTSVFNTSSAFKRFDLGLRVQGHDCSPSGKLWVSRNVQQGLTVTGGYFQQYDIQAAISGTANGAVLVAERTMPAPSQYPQDITFHPVTGHVWTSTEGLGAVVDIDGWLSIWSSPLDGSSVFNHYTLDYNGSDQLAIRINGFSFQTMPWTINQAAEVVSVGGLPLASDGFLNGFSMAHVANVVIQNAPLSSEGYIAAVSGSYEPNVLTVHALALTNSGAELGSSSGWTVESGAMAVRSANPLPFEGAFYFAGGNVVSSVSRQRLDLVAQGVPSAEIDAGACWAKIRWRQSAYSDQDPGGMGLRTLSASAGSIATTYSGLAWVPHGGGASGPWYWYPRSLPVPLAVNTRLLDALYNASGRTSGTANDHYVDAVSVVVYER